MKQNTQELILFLVVSIKNFFIALLFTSIFGLYNIVVFKTMTLTYGNITWDFIIFFCLCLFDCIFYKVFRKK